MGCLIAVTFNAKSRRNASPALWSTFVTHPFRLCAMGTVHKFKRPPKNQQQFRGYQPRPPQGPAGGKTPRRQLRGWQRSIIAWSALVLLAVGIWAINALISNA